MKYLLFPILFILTSCQKQDDKALEYYFKILDVKNFFMIQSNNFFSDIDEYTDSEADNLYLLNENDKAQLYSRLSLLSIQCDSLLKSMAIIGPYKNDSTLYNIIIESLILTKRLSNKDFISIIDCFSKSTNHYSCALNAYEALLQMAEVQENLADDIISFKRRYKLNINLKHTRKAKISAYFYKKFILLRMKQIVPD